MNNPNSNDGWSWDTPTNTGGVGTSGTQGGGYQQTSQNFQWEDHANHPSDMQNQFIPTQDPTYQSPILDKPKKKINLGYAAIAVIISIACIILAVVLYTWDNAPVKEQPSGGNSVITEAPPSNTTNTNTVAEGSVVLVEIPTDIYLNYTGDILDASGTIVSKTKYVLDHQVIYCITIRVAVGSSAEDVRYFCNYASYSNVGVGDLVFLKYQQVSDGFISVNEIYK